MYLEFNGEGILFDCGEGIQRQFKIAGIAPTKIRRICITHWHGDHVLGLPGLLLTLGACGYTGVLHLYGPSGSKEYLGNMMSGFAEKISIDVEVHEIAQGMIFENDLYMLSCAPLEHSIECFGFSFIEKDRRRIIVPFIRKLGIPDGPLLGKLQRGIDVVWEGKNITVDEATRVVHGKKVVYIGDTLFCNSAVGLSLDADLLITEATLSDTIEEKAENYKHMTAKQAAMLANHANAKKLIITHFSQRYKTMEVLEEEAQTVFANTQCAYDFLKIKI
ncbi:ribonuclease [Candidatus Woesearchaeota archaeon CG08_land_8_20_14_0_20_43_7]|nr:MAG: ribonuclease [Candidatus Woesearchaeota archaeon CG08_land_8_20_14_0_20_43_7]